MKNEIKEWYVQNEVYQSESIIKDDELNKVMRNKEKHGNGGNVDSEG